MYKVTEEIKNGAFVCLAICAADGFISTEEEEVLEANFEEYFNVTKAEFQNMIDCFFESSSQVEVFLEGVEGKKLRQRLLQIAKEAAAADGLDITENIAWNKCKLYWE